LEARFGGGRALAQLSLHAGPDGTAARGRLALSDIDVAAVLPADARAPVTGRAGLQVEAEGTGLSPATLVGSLRGAGTLTLENAQIAGLDPKAFETVVRAVDRGLAIDGTKVRDMMDTALSAGRLTVPRVDGAFSLTAGQARWGNVVAPGEGADLTISGIVDLAQSSMDARLILSGAVGASPESAGRPDVFMALR